MKPPNLILPRAHWKPPVYALPPEGTQQCNTHQRRFPAWGTRVWSWSRHMSRTASGPHKCSTRKSCRQKTKSKFPHVTPLSGSRWVSSFSPFICYKERNVCCLAVINPSFVLEQSDRPTVLSENRINKRRIWIFAPTSRTQGGQKTLISSHHCRAMTNVPLLIRTNGGKLQV